MSETKVSGHQCSFRVEVKNEKRPHSKHPKHSYTRLVDVRLSQTTVRLHRGGSVFVDGKKVEPVYKTSVLTVLRDREWVNVTTECGLNVAFDGDKVAVVEMPKMFANMTLGLCGDCDGDEENDVSVDGKPFFMFPNIWEGYRALSRLYLIADDSDKPDTSKACEPPLRPYGPNILDG
ncbi:hypothetical protein EGW08_002395 [Elysia chlorotica]|uniref:VWFD domain-containing protein n=1 Tax=Elysia chlorotica TaxID=188477 RepID=A0A3S1I0K8_ELYCH|nr:hypothetical protein EGW08_002395 [Elysia chlorotica]